MSEPEFKETEEMTLNGEAPASAPAPEGELPPGYGLNGSGEPAPAAPAPEKPRLEGGKLLLVTIAVVLGIGLIVVFFAMRDTDKVKPKTFTSGPVTITLTNRFWKDDSTARQNDIEAVFSSQDVGVFAWKKGYTMLDELADYTPEGFAGVLVYTAEIPTRELKSEDGLTWFVYDEQGDDGVTYRYYAYVYKTDSAFWVVEFAVDSSQSADYPAQIHEWAGSVKIEE
ncbi:MAG: hypothetical protein IJL78_01310 [Lachnospiraceae bacterium]|nr:hypothetical protein [Lachnospiraceae bacterium]